MNIDQFDFELPKERIAQRPAEPRTHAKLMVLKEGTITQDVFYNILNYLQRGDVLVVNETKVIPARITGKKQSGGKIELTLEGEKTIVKGKVKIGDVLVFKENIRGTVIEKNNNEIKVNFSHPREEIIRKIGELPTPPYIKERLQKDEEYQTIFAKKEGAMAAPTAGLHFDKELLKKIENKGVTIAHVCLHVSGDTFLPVKETEIEKHVMHGEWCEIDETNTQIINNAKRLFVVGTTALKTLETLTDEKGMTHAGKKHSTIFIYPGYQFKKKYTALITNFHLPKSTLMMLVSAFYNREKILEAYRTAVENNYRFYSLGDAMLIFKEV